MLGFLLQKILSKKWLMLCILIGNVLFVSIICCISYYSDGIWKRMLSRKMDHYMEEHNEYPMKMTLNSSLTVVSKKRHNGKVFEEVQSMAADMGKKAGIPYKEFITHYSVSVKSVPQITRNNQKEILQLQLGYLSELEEHIEIVSGEVYQKNRDNRGIISVMVSEKMLAAQKLLLDEILAISNLSDKDGNQVQVQIAGVFRYRDVRDAYWVKNPSSYETMLFMPQGLFEELFVDFDTPRYALRGTWEILFDYHNLTAEQVINLINVTEEYHSYDQQQTAVTFADNYIEVLQQFQQEENKTGETLWILQMPILVLLAAFIMMVSKQLLALEHTELAVMKSRGIGKSRIVLLYMGQSLILGIVSCILGIPIGILLCQVLGSSNGFMEFVIRERLYFNIWNKNILLCCFISLLVFMIVTIIPVLRYGDTTIVEHKQKKGSLGSLSIGRRLGLDFIPILTGGYGYFRFRGKETELTEQILEGKSLDPLLYFSSSLFILGAGFLVIRLIPVLVQIIFSIGKKLWNPPLYASFIRVIRFRHQQNFIVMFLILTIALGIFNVQIARTINANDENNILYRNGAEIVLQEMWGDNQKIVAADSTGTTRLSYQEPDFNKYLNIKGVQSAAKVYMGSAAVDGNRQIELMGIDTKEFGETAWFTNELLDTHWFHYLNAMNQSSYGVLVSESFRKEMGYQLGDTLYYTVNGYQTRGIIFGFVDYWPRFNPASVLEFRGTALDVENYLIVAHRSHLQSLMGIVPYHIYIKTDGKSSEVYDYLLEEGIPISYYSDAAQAIIDHKNDAVLQGTNGMLTVGFITVLLLCIIGFFIFWILSIQSRTLQFGIFRAMGMRMREIMEILVNEQIFITGTSVIAGVLVGIITSKLYVPLIQIAYASKENILPLTVINRTQDTMQIILAVSVMIIVSIGILGVLISKTKITQALKLGED